MIRYQRQLLLDNWGKRGQDRIKEAKVFIAGAGGLGCPVAQSLALAGVGFLRICDFDEIELSNLNRQFLHNETRLGQNKALSAKETLATINPEVMVAAVTEKITEANVAELIAGVDIVIDCLDNFATRYLLNQAVFNQGIPLVYGSVWGLEGRVSFLQPPATPCFQCVFPSPPPKGVFPILGATAAVVGSIQALEALKYLVGIGELLRNRLLICDLATMNFQQLNLEQDPSCPICSKPK